MWKKISKVWILAALFVFAALPVLAASPLTIGSRGDEVRSIQQILRSKGYRVNVNGVYTKDTAQAVSQYQKDKKIQVSGKVGGWTYYLLTGNRSKLPPKPVMKKGQSTRFNNGAISKYRHFSGGDAFGNQLVHSAYQYLGIPYVFGGNTPAEGFDCSGFTKYVFSHNGINLPRLADEQYEVGQRVRRSELMPGDLVFFTTYEPGVSRYGHLCRQQQFHQCHQQWRYPRRQPRQRLLVAALCRCYTGPEIGKLAREQSSSSLSLYNRPVG